LFQATGLTLVMRQLHNLQILNSNDLYLLFATKALTELKQLGDALAGSNSGVLSQSAHELKV